MINLPLNFSAPTGKVQNTYAAPTRTNPYLTSSQYEGMQLHTPSGYYYQGGKFYEPYTPTPIQRVQQAINPYATSVGPNFNRNNQTTTTGGPVTGSVQVGNQYFKPFTGNATGIINGDLSMAAMTGQTPQYQPQGIPSNLLNLLSSPDMQQTNNQTSSGVGRFAGLLGSPIVTTNTQNVPYIENNYNSLNNKLLPSYKINYGNDFNLDLSPMMNSLQNLSQVKNIPVKDIDGNIIQTTNPLYADRPKSISNSISNVFSNMNNQTSN